MPCRHYYFLYLVILMCIPAFSHAHHSWPASYHVDREITLEGKVLRYLWRNPHVFIYLEVTNDQGEIEKWEVEMGNTNVMIRRGWSEETIKTGDEVILGGWPGRSDVKRVNMQWLKRPVDGLELTPPERQ